MFGKPLDRLGLIDDAQDAWSRFQARIEELQQSAPDGTLYKVLLFNRHGQGYHNLGVYTPRELTRSLLNIRHSLSQVWL